MDFFKRIQQPAKFETPVIEERKHWNKGLPLTEETRAKISAAKKGKPLGPNGPKGKPKSAETRAKLSAANKGKTLSPEHRAKISAGRKGRGLPLTEETRAKISAAMKDKKKACKTPLGVFESIAAAARAHNLHADTVRSHLNGSVRSDWHFVEKTAKKVVDK